MNILALETSGELCSAALWRDGDVSVRESAAGQRNSDVLLPMVDELLNAHALRPVDLDGVAFGSGPGSFTGLRIACGVAQGIAFGAGVPVAPIETLLAMAQASGARRAVCCLDARMGEIYHAAYEKHEDAWHAVHEASLCRAQQAPELPLSGWTGCGNGFAVYRQALERRYEGKLARIQADVMPRAGVIAVLAAVRFERGEVVAPEHAAPVYVRNKIALSVSERKG